MELYDLLEKGTRLLFVDEFITDYFHNQICILKGGILTMRRYQIILIVVHHKLQVLSHPITSHIFILYGQL